MGDRKKILVIDDERDIRLLLNKRLTANGYEVLEAGDGVSGIACAKKEHPDLVLLDAMMPGMDGIETYHALHRDSDTKNIPIIFLTVLAQNIQTTTANLELEKSFAIIGKPYQPQELLKEIQRALGEPGTP